MCMLRSMKWLSPNPFNVSALKSHSKIIIFTTTFNHTKSPNDPYIYKRIKSEPVRCKHKGSHDIALEKPFLSSYPLFYFICALFGQVTFLI